ncbi:MAG TPA: hypothetical protein PKI77_19230 [Mycobacterium sp.]|nr:hypothetical protein [Mycobacterium sp.]
MRRADEATQINEIIERLNARYTELQVGDVADLVNAELARFSGSKLREFVPLFVERNARAKLSAREPLLAASS